MAVLPVLAADKPVLRQKAKKVSIIDSSIQRLIDDMIETCAAVGGVGLAAPQVGVPLRIAVIELPDEEPRVLINPEIVKTSGERTVEEGCLSLPGYRGTIIRSEKVTAKALDRKGRAVRIKAEGLLAQALQHEIDHINGVLYFDHLESIDELERVEAMRETLIEEKADRTTE